MATERHFTAMGHLAHVAVLGGRPGLAGGAQARLLALDERWSPDRPGSEIRALARHAGAFLTVSDHTVRLARLAVEAGRLTGGRFAPLVPRHPGGGCSTLVAVEAMVVEPARVRLPAATVFDPGALALGFALDLVGDWLLDAGADGALIGLGPDLRLGVGDTADRGAVAVSRRDGAEPVTVRAERAWQAAVLAAP